MRTNIVIDDKLMAEVMAMGDFKTKKDAVEEGLRLLKRQKAYAALLAARGTLFWDDSDEAWARAREVDMPMKARVQEPAAGYAAVPAAEAKPSQATRARAKPGKRSKAT